MVLTGESSACPPLDGDCAPEDLRLDDQGCCQICTPKNTSKSKNINCVSVGNMPGRNATQPLPMCTYNVCLENGSDQLLVTLYTLSIYPYCNQVIRTLIEVHIVLLIN